MSTSRFAGWRAHRHRSFAAFVVHRVSGLALLAFLPVHFTMLSIAVRDAAAFDRFAAWTDRPLVRFAEALLVGLLAVHLAGGLRLMAIECLPWSDVHKNLAAVGFAIGVACGVGFLLAA